MSSKPIRKSFSAYFACCNLEDDLLLFIHTSDDLIAVEDQKRFHCCVADTFVAVHEGVILDEAKSPAQKPSRL